MSEERLGQFADDPRSVQGTLAIDLLDTEGHEASHEQRVWEMDLDADPRETAAKAAILEARSFDSYRQSGAWVLRAGTEVAPGQDQ